MNVSKIEAVMPDTILKQTVPNSMGSGSPCFPVHQGFSGLGKPQPQEPPWLPWPP